MSYYYQYYAGYCLDGKIYPWGPYNANGDIKPILSRSASYASDLHERFRPIQADEISNELRAGFEVKDWHGDPTVPLKILDLEDLPDGDFIKRGYFLIDDVQQYEANGDSYFDGFYNMLTPQIYAAKMSNELKFGPKKPKRDIEGNEFEEHSAGEYYAYPDYESEEYESFIIRIVVELLKNYDMPEGAKYVVLEREG